MFPIGTIVNTPRGEGIVSAHVGAPSGGVQYLVLLKERDETWGNAVMMQYIEDVLSQGRAHPTYTIGQRVSYKGRGAEITAIADDLTITLRLDNPPIGDNPIAFNNTAVLPHWRLTMLEEFQQ